MTTEQDNKEAIIRIEGKLELMDSKLGVLKDNHLFHIEKDMRQLRALVWFIGTTVFAQMMFIVLRTFMQLMAKIWKSQEGHIHTPKGTSIGRHPITSTMNKKKKANFKPYRGQGKRR